MDTLTSDYKKSLKNPYIEENQTTQWQKNVQKDKHGSIQLNIE